MAPEPPPSMSHHESNMAFQGSTRSSTPTDTTCSDLASDRVSVLTEGGGEDPSWNPDGQSVAYVDDGDAKEIDLSTGEVIKLINAPFTANATRFRTVRSISYPRPATADSLARSFQPNLFFDTSENYRPVSVESLLGEREDGSLYHDLCNSSDVCGDVRKSADLQGYPGAGSYLDFGTIDNGLFETPRSPRCLDDDDLLDCETSPVSAIYYHVSSDASYTYLDYWMFYRYNWFPTPWPAPEFSHEGDWESVTVAVSGAENWDATEFAYVSFSQHGRWGRYLPENIHCAAGGLFHECNGSYPGDQRVSSFVARGSHANYPGTCSAVLNEPTCLQDTNPGTLDNFEYGHDGERPWAENGDLSSLLRMPPAASAAEDSWDAGQPHNWTDWPGTWGAGGDVDSPSSPASGPNGEHFYSPGDYQCAEDNEDCDDPLSRGASADSRVCQDWFGWGVNILVCDPEKLQKAEEDGRLTDRGGLSVNPPEAFTDSSGTAPGLSQSAGQPLRAGSRFRIHGPTTADAELLVRVRIGDRFFALVSRDSAGFEGTLKILRTRSGEPRLIRVDGGRRNVKFRLLSQ